MLWNFGNLEIQEGCRRGSGNPESCNLKNNMEDFVLETSDLGTVPPDV